MAQQICFYNAQKAARNLRRGLYRQEICRPLGFPVVQRKTSCCEPRIPTLVYPKCGRSYRRTPPDLLHHYDFKPTCPRPSCPPCPSMSSLVLPTSPAWTCSQPVCGPGMNIMAQVLPSTYPCSPCPPKCDTICTPSLYPTTRLPVVSCSPGTGFVAPQAVGIPGLQDNECQKLGLCGYQKNKCCYLPPAIAGLQMTANCCYEQKWEYTSLPELTEPCVTPKPWRDPCGGRIYYRLTDYDLKQQW